LTAPFFSLFCGASTKEKRDMTDLTSYSTTELCTALVAALGSADALDGTGLDMATRWQEEAESRADRIALELQGRVGDSEAEELERAYAIAAYAVRLMALPG
jgi:hypothetical protein